jgi:hypothetical protein
MSNRILFVVCGLVLFSSPLQSQARPRPQYQCGPQPTLDSVTTEGSKWLSCEHNYWSSVYRAAKMLSRYEGIEGNCLEQFSQGFREAAGQFLTGRWAEGNTTKARLTCAAGRQVRIDTESISLLCTDQRWTVQNAGIVNCPDPMAQNEQVNLSGWSENRGDTQVLMVRNNSAARVVRITEWTVYDCMNLRGSICRRHTRPVIIRPGQSAELIELRPEQLGREWRYQWSWVAEFVE